MPIVVLSLLSVLLLLEGCIDAAIVGGTYAYKKSDRPELKILAEAGDVEAQYQLGKRLCCAGPGFDTQEATIWLCRAAKAGHKDAQYELGRIYSGEVSRIPAAGPKIISLVFASESYINSWFWYTQAARQGHKKAQKHASNLSRKLDPQELETASNWQENLASIKCEYEEIFPD